jgi:transposase-like protein
VLHAVHGNVSEAARRLGISRNTLYRKRRASPSGGCWRGFRASRLAGLRSGIDG